jgi:hypothetical protein
MMIPSGPRLKSMLYLTYLITVHAQLLWLVAYHSYAARVVMLFAMLAVHGLVMFAALLVLLPVAVVFNAFNVEEPFEQEYDHDDNVC